MKWFGIILVLLSTLGIGAIFEFTAFSKSTNNQTQEEAFQRFSNLRESLYSYAQIPPDNH